MHDTYVPGRVDSADDPFAGAVLIKLDDNFDSINSIKIPSSMCWLKGVAYKIDNRNPKADTLEIALQELICDANGVIESNKIDIKLMDIKAKSIPATAVRKENLESLKGQLKALDKRGVIISEYRIKEIEAAQPFFSFNREHTNS
jgi:hypothetical protein